MEKEYFQVKIADYLIQKGIWQDVSFVSFDEENQAAEVHFKDDTKGLYVVKDREVRK